MEYCIGLVWSVVLGWYGNSVVLGWYGNSVVLGWYGVLYWAGMECCIGLVWGMVLHCTGSHFIIQTPILKNTTFCTDRAISIET